MEDTSIINLYFARSEQAIVETDTKYGRYCYQIAYHILDSREDSKESVNDTYLAAWNAMPPRRPNILSAFLGRITRNISLNRWKQRSTQKRGSGQVPLALEELEDCVAGGNDPEQNYQKKELARGISRFLRQLPEPERQVFVCRYWYLDTSQEIADRFGFSESKVRSMLFRLRKRLNTYLETEDLL